MNLFFFFYFFSYSHKKFIKIKDFFLDESKINLFSSTVFLEKKITISMEDITLLIFFFYWCKYVLPEENFSKLLENTIVCDNLMYEDESLKKLWKILEILPEILSYFLIKNNYLYKYNTVYNYIIFSGQYKKQPPNIKKIKQSFNKNIFYINFKKKKIKKIKKNLFLKIKKFFIKKILSCFKNPFSYKNYYNINIYEFISTDKPKNVLDEKNKFFSFILQKKNIEIDKKYDFILFDFETESDAKIAMYFFINYKNIPFETINKILKNQYNITFSMRQITTSNKEISKDLEENLNNLNYNEYLNNNTQIFQFKKKYFCLDTIFVPPSLKEKIINNFKQNIFLIINSFNLQEIENYFENTYETE